MLEMMKFIEEGEETQEKRRNKTIEMQIEK